MDDDKTELAPVERCQTRPSDLEYFKALAGDESRETIRQEKIADDLYLRVDQVKDEIFRFNDGEGHEYWFNVRKIKDGLASNTIPFLMFKATVTREWYEHVLKNGGVEEERVALKTEADLDKPGVCCVWPDMRSAIIDGNHRLVARYRAGKRDFRYAAVELQTIGKSMDLVKVRTAHASAVN